jgi:hypothetical protein
MAPPECFWRNYCVNSYCGDFTQQPFIGTLNNHLPTWSPPPLVPHSLVETNSTIY